MKVRESHSMKSVLSTDGIFPYPAAWRQYRAQRLPELVWPWRRFQPGHGHQGEVQLVGGGPVQGKGTPAADHPVDALLTPFHSSLPSVATLPSRGHRPQHLQRPSRRPLRPRLIAHARPRPRASAAHGGPTAGAASRAPTTSLAHRRPRATAAVATRTSRRTSARRRRRRTRTSLPAWATRTPPGGRIYPRVRVSRLPVQQAPDALADRLV